MQNSETLIIDSGLFGAPAKEGMTTPSGKVVVGTTGGALGDSEIFGSSSEEKAYL
jgi:hypothetical protein